ncbi:hypothetical protein [Halobacillus hunanensis]|uniref:hypothetical protein n=1 Tax=Halobacillus hunanensis TaxID=578214 RepID=UPI00159204F1|nr:hypothetical protein [Halobacillus hunanensis]
MELRKPIAVNKRDKPVIIFENGVELIELPSIQKAADWLKKYIGKDTKSFNAVHSGFF